MAAPSSEVKPHWLGHMTLPSMIIHSLFTQQISTLSLDQHPSKLIIMFAMFYVAFLAYFWEYLHCLNEVLAMESNRLLVIHVAPDFAWPGFHVQQTTSKKMTFFCCHFSAMERRIAVKILPGYSRTIPPSFALEMDVLRALKVVEKWAKIQMHPRDRSGYPWCGTVADKGDQSESR